MDVTSYFIGASLEKGRKHRSGEYSSKQYIVILLQGYDNC
jgi:hypothetical protein